MNRAVESVSAFFPCYNDEATIGAMVEAAASTLDRIGADGEIIVVNDGSSDGSERVLKHLTETEPRLRVVTHEHNRGYGGALLSGFGAATNPPVPPLPAPNTSVTGTVALPPLTRYNVSVPV